MNAETIIQAIIANLGDPQAMAKRSELMQIPKLSGKGLSSVTKRFALLGKAHAHAQLLAFLKRLQSGMQDEKDKNAAASAAASGEGETALAAGRVPADNSLDESQYHSPTGKHLRDQSAYPASINPSMSFGGVFDTGGRKKSKKKRACESLDTIFKTITIDEEIAVRHGGAALAAERGQFIIDGEIAIDNHADVLKILVMVLADNNPEALRSAVDNIADMVKSGAIFRK